MVLLGDLLRPKVLLHRQREVRPALDRRIVCDDDAVTALDHADTADDPGSRRLAVIELPGRERVQLEEGAARVDEQHRSARAPSACRASDGAPPPFAPPPRATTAVLSRSSATRCSIRSRRARDSRAEGSNRVSRTVTRRTIRPRGSSGGIVAICFAEMEGQRRPVLKPCGSAGRRCGLMILSQRGHIRPCRSPRSAGRAPRSLSSARGGQPPVGICPPVRLSSA